MSVITTTEETLRQSTAQLPVDWYVSEEIYALETAHLFSRAPKYIGHQLMVPNLNDYYTIDWMDNAKALVNHDGEISLVSNICRHRQALMLDGRGSTSHIVCPLHRWTYALDGKLLGAPHFSKNPCLHLNKTPLYNWHGMLFEGPQNIAEILDSVKCKADFDFSGYHYDSTHVDHYDFNWKTFIETYLEDYHVGPFHPGLNQFVDCDKLDWQFAQDYSMQTVGYKDLPHHFLSPTYQRWQNAVARYHGQKKPKHGAIWFAYYPFLMIEWYPQVLVVSHLVPTGVHSCSNVVEFYYPEEIALFEREYVAAQQAAYIETAVEDKEICDRMHQGRRALHKLSIDERGPYQHPMETGMAHFHEWYRHNMEPHLSKTK